jgi:two-component system, NarL family, response regulator NreC
MPDAMETIPVIIAEISPLARLGIIGILKGLGYSLTIKEVIHADKLPQVLHKDQKQILIISSSFINAGSTEVWQKVLIYNKLTAKVLIRDTGLLLKSPPCFDEIIEPEDHEKIITRKFGKLIAALSASGRVVLQDEEISEREKEVLQLVALGLTNKEIAEKLYISSHTVITHRKNITSKLGIKTIAGLTVYAVIHKLIAPEHNR